MLAILDPTSNTYIPWTGQAVNDVVYPMDIESDPTDWTTASYNAAGFFPVNLFQVPAGQQIIGPATYTLDADGQTVDQVFPTTAATTVTLIDAINDGDAASQGVAIGQNYRNGSVVMIRVS